MGEYLRLKPEDLRLATYGLHVHGTKTAGSDDLVVVGEEWWSWAKDAVPAPLGYAWLRKHWSRACAAVHVTGVTLHSLRHCCGQWAVNAGVPEAQVQAAYGTRRRARRGSIRFRKRVARLPGPWRVCCCPAVRPATGAVRDRSAQC